MPNRVTLDVPRELRRVQDRLYSALEVILDGILAGLYPETKGKAVVLRLECWGTPDAPVRDFFERWATHVQSDNEFAPSIARCPHVSSIGFVYEHGELGRNNQPLEWAAPGHRSALRYTPRAASPATSA
jgi:hypothetical protein